MLTGGINKRNEKVFIGVSDMFGYGDVYHRLFL